MLFYSEEAKLAGALHCIDNQEKEAVHAGACHDFPTLHSPLSWSRENAAHGEDRPSQIVKPRYPLKGMLGGYITPEGRYVAVF